MRQRWILIGGAIGLAVALATAGTALGLSAPGGSGSPGDPSSQAGCSASAPKLTVQGTGISNATPDLLTVSVGIDVTDSTAQNALADDNAKTSAVTAALTQGGVAADDVQTTGLSIQPDYNAKGVITGYGVSNTLTAKLRDFAKAGSVIDSLAGAAGNSVRVDSLTFSIDDPRAVEDQARNQAVSQAVAHARTMAQAAGERLGPLCSLTDNAQTVNPYQDQAGAGLTAPSGSAAVPLAPGTQQETAQVSVVYALDSSPGAG